MLEYGRNNNKLFGGNYMIEYKKIIIKNKKQYIKNERKNFSYYTFNQYDLPQLEFAYSFFRSDFRGATFDNVTLLETDFDRSDFIDSRFLNSNFISVKFGASENKNAVYKCCNFNSCSYKGAVFTTTIFSECIFKNIHFICNFDRCKFINCQFINCQFNRSSVEECTFLKCELTDTDLAQCHAENLIFIDTFLQNVFLGAPFIPNYLIRNTNISDAKLKYRGKIVPITKYTELFENTLYQQKRYFELLNISIIHAVEARNLASTYLFLVFPLFSLLYSLLSLLLDQLSLHQLFEDLFFIFSQQHFRAYFCGVGRLFAEFDLGRERLFHSAVGKDIFHFDVCVSAAHLNCVLFQELFLFVGEGRRYFHDSVDLFLRFSVCSQRSLFSEC